MAPTQAPLPLEGKKERTRRARLLRALLVLLLLFVGSMGGGLSWFQAKWGQDWLHAFVEGQVRHMMGEGGFEIGGVDADQWGVIELSDVVLTDGTDREVVRLDRVRAEYRVDLDEQRVVVDELLVRGGEVDLLLDEEGLLDLERMFPPSGKDPFELPGDVQLRSIVIQDVHWAYTDAEQTLAMGTLGLNATGAGSGTVWSFDIVSGGGVLEEPTLGDFDL